MTDDFLEPRARIPLFRGEVKEYCAGIIQVTFLALPPNVGQNLGQTVQGLLSQYRYIYPTSGHVSAPLFLVGRGSSFVRATLSLWPHCLQGPIGAPGSFRRSSNYTSKEGPMPSLVILTGVSVSLFFGFVLSESL